jgi:VWFA-related protein
VFRAGTQLVSVDVVVRDGSGAVVRGLTREDFTILEDGRPQQIQTFSFEEISDQPRPGAQRVDLLATVEERLKEDLQRAPATAAARPASPGDGDAAAGPATLAGRRLVVLLFDVSSMEPEDVQRAVDSAVEYVDGQMAPSDLVAVVTIGSTLNVLTDFTSVREQVSAALGQLAYTEGTAVPPPAAVTVATEEAEAAAETTTADETGFDTFNNDVRLRAIKTLADTLAPIEQKKAILYFSAGLPRTGSDNQVELRSAINAAVRGNVAIYPVDARGLQAVAPGGDASRASGRGVSLFTGQAVQRQFAALTSSQETLTTLAADTGGQAFTDTNSFGAAFTRVQRDLSAYYLIGYSSTNPARDGRFRRIQVRVSRRGARVEARAGYYADRDFRNTSGRDREAQLEEQLAAPVSATDVPVVVGTGWFRLDGDRFFVPISMAVPGSAVPVEAGRETVTLDVRGIVRDEQGRPVGRLRETMRLAAGPAPTLAGKQVLYQSGVLLPPGRFSVKVVVRENTSGAVGSFEAPIVVPQLRDAPVKMSSVVLSTQVQPVAGGRGSPNPLARGGVQLLPNLTRVVTRGQSVYFYYEVYDPALADEAPQVRTNLAFYRGAVKVYETPLVEREVLDEPGRRAVVFRFEVPAKEFTPGTYTCQVNIIDAVAGRVAFPRLSFQVRER